MKLYMHPASPNVRAVLMTAELLELPLEKQLVDAMAGEQSTPAYLKVNPNGLFPVLLDGDFVLWETIPIMQYVASKKLGNALWPKEDRRRADICRWQCWSLAHWSPALRIYIFENMFKRLKGLGEPDLQAIQNGEEAYHRFAHILDEQLKAQAYISGAQLTLADLSVSSYLMYATAARIPLEPFANVQRWFESIQSLPAWQRTAPQMAQPQTKQGEIA
jgi:glutathione S-transferase